MQNASVPLLALAHFADGSWLDISTRPGLSISSASPLLLQAEHNASSWQASPALSIKTLSVISRKVVCVTYRSLGSAKSACFVSPG